VIYKGDGLCLKHFNIVRNLPTDFPTGELGPVSDSIIKQYRKLLEDYPV
jgi:hypothetical protein